MSFQNGNKHGAKSRMFDGALKRAIAQDDGKRLRDAAEKLLDLAAGGEPWAIKELADRLDGKSQQSVNVTKTDVTDLSLSELAAELASAIAEGSGATTEGPAGDTPVH